jgi:hypothetical protein
MPTTVRKIEIEVGGKRYSGSYLVEGGTLRVMYMGARKSTKMGKDSPPDQIAQTLLRELIAEVEAP